MIALNHKSRWFRFRVAILIVCWVWWLGGNWEDEFSPEYVPPRFDQLQKSQGVITFTRQSKSSGGEIELLLGNGKRVHLSCTRPYSLPVACYYKRVNGKWLNESYRDQLMWKNVTVWWMGEKKNSDGEDVGRVYQLQIGDQIFFEYQERLDYYLSYKIEKHGHNWYFGFALLLLTALLIKASLRRRLSSQVA